MRQPKYIDPLPELPAYERNIIRLRSLEISLALYYAEEIRRTVLGMVRNTDNLRARGNHLHTQHIPSRRTNDFKKALMALIADGTITKNERDEIVALTDFRNDIGHRIDHLFSDLQTSVVFLDSEIKSQMGIKEFQHDAVEKMRALLRKLHGLTLSGSFVLTFRFDGPLMFSNTERLLVREIERSREKLARLSTKREKEIAVINEDLKTGYQILREIQKDRHFDIRFENGPMTKRGEEFCFRMFDCGVCLHAVALIFQMKLPSIQKRHKRWLEQGATSRSRVDIASLPVQIARSYSDD